METRLWKQLIEQKKPLTLAVCIPSADQIGSNSDFLQTLVQAINFARVGGRAGILLQCSEVGSKKNLGDIEDYVNMILDAIKVNNDELLSCQPWLIYKDGTSTEEEESGLPDMIYIVILTKFD